MSGNYAFRAGLAVSLLGLAVCTVNALTILDDAARAQLQLPRWMPWATEYTSLAGLVAALPLAALVERRSAAAILWRRLALLLAGSIIFCLLHIAVMVGLRQLLWLLWDRHYVFDFTGAWLYEYRKDLVSYAIVLVAFAIARRWQTQARIPDPPGRSSGIRLSDGSRGLLVQPAALLAARSGGNYVELVFAEGPRRLIRSTLASVEAALGPHGFDRSHKGWLVRLDAVTAVEPTGTGDYRLTVGENLQIPLSRRYTRLLPSLRERLHHERR